jgi:hypothetical protein
VLGSYEVGVTDHEQNQRVRDLAPVERLHQRVRPAELSLSRATQLSSPGRDDYAVESDDAHAVL